MINTIEDGRCSYMVALLQGVDIQGALALDWSGDVAEGLAFHCCVHEKKGLFFKRLGEFDDCERGFISVGSLDVMKELLS